jgi:hypothetical protein
MTFAEQFAHSKGEPIQIQGRTVHGIYRLRVDRSLELRIRWVRAANELSQGILVQGVNLKTRAGTLGVADSRGASVVLWTDTAPPEVTLTLEGPVREISLWNCWKDVQGTQHAWINNGGMLIEQREGGVLRFRCNSRMDVTFEDLVFDLECRAIG